MEKMEPELWQRVQPLFATAQELDPKEWGAFMEQHVGDDEALRRELESLLEAGRESGDFLEPLAAADELTFDRYKVVGRLGSGGVGTVYEAVRNDDEYRQRVALKLLKRGMDTDEIVRRFKTERQILAALDHPSIARLLDGGSTGDGLPYLVMEHVEGQPLDVYCDTHKLSIRERLDLFERVCSAVHYAHQNLVVHRDLKPANILVTADGNPKLLDFGIAKLLNPELSAQSQARTATGFALMTPDFASPEQVRGDPITTASDVYSLGVVLYALLSGHRPYHLCGASRLEMERRVCETKPEPLSAAVRRHEESPGGDAASRPLTPELVSEQRGVEPAELCRCLQGDLENIVAMAMRREPQRRYASVEQFAADVRRHLDGLPVLASGDSLRYRWHKLLRRNRGAVAAAATVVAAVLGFGLVMTVQTVKLRDALAREQFVTDFLVDLFEGSDPGMGERKLLSLEEILDRGRDRLQAEFVPHGPTRARLTGTVGKIYGRQGDYIEAERLLREALELRREPDLEVATNLAYLGEVLLNQGRYSEAEELLREALELRRRLLGDEHGEVAETLNLLAGVLKYQDELAEAERVYGEALALFRRAGDDGQVASCLNNLAVLHQHRGNLDAVEPLLREALELRRRLFDSDHPMVANSLHNLASLLQVRGDLEGAESLYGEALAILRRSLGDQHPELGRSLVTHASVLIQMERFAAADDQLREALGILRAQHAEGHWLPSYAESLRGACLIGLERFAEAEPLLDRSYKALKAVTGDSGYTRKTLERLVGVRKELGIQPTATRTNTTEDV